MGRRDHTHSVFNLLDHQDRCSQDKHMGPGWHGAVPWMGRGRHDIPSLNKGAMGGRVEGKGRNLTLLSTYLPPGPLLVCQEAGPTR